jgi:hypothetical protein
MGQRAWGAPSIRMIGQVFEMLPLTVTGVEQLAIKLAER